MGGNNEFFENFERNKYLKKLPSMQRVKLSPVFRKLFLPLYRVLARFMLQVVVDL